MAYTVHGILQARILEWVAVPFSRGSSKPRIEPRSPALRADSLPPEPSGKPQSLHLGPCLSTLPPVSEDCAEMARTQPCPQHFTVEVESEHFVFRKTVW